MPIHHMDQKVVGLHDANHGYNCFLPFISPTQQSAIQKGGGRDDEEEEDDYMCWRMMAGGERR